jgi:hypothetical protein
MASHFVLNRLAEHNKTKALCVKNSFLKMELEIFNYSFYVAAFFFLKLLFVQILMQ